ncbi:putative reverse transcriptase domain-containing protein [Tanacetum coccineum]
MSPCAQPRRPLDLMSLYVFGSVPEKVHDFVEGLPYHGDSSHDDLVGNSRTNFVYPWRNDAGLSVEERALLFLKAQDHSICYLVFFTTSVGIRAEVPVKMPPRKNRPLTEAYEQEFEQRVMARIEERLYQFVDQFADRMNDMMNPRRRRDRNNRGSEGEGSENPFFEDDDTSSDDQPDRPRRNQREDDRRWESGMRINIPEFDGKTLNPEGFIDWLVTVEEVFEFKEGTKSVEDYTTEFYQLIARNDIQETDDQLVSRYIGGLRVQIMDSVNMFDPVTLSDAYQRALVFEKQNRRVGSSSSPAVTGGSFGSGNVTSRFVPIRERGGVVPGQIPKGLEVVEWEDNGLADNDYEEPPVFDDEQYEEEIVSGDVGITLMPNKPKELVNKPTGNLLTLSQFQDELQMVDDAFVLIGKEVAPDSKIPEARFHLHKEFCGVFPNELPDRSPPLCDIQRHIDLESSLQFPNMGESEDLRRQVKDLVSKGHVCERMSPCAQPRRPLDLMSLYVFGSVPEKVHDFVEGLPYHGDSSDDDLAGNSFIGQWSLANAKNLSSILTCFNLASGLKVNINKSNLYGIGAHSNYLNRIASAIAPVTIINKLESIRRNFFWGGNSNDRKIAWVAWEKVLAPHDQGELNIGSLKVFNQAMLAKWWWRFLNEENALWRKLVISIHGSNGGLTVGSSSLYKSGPWYYIRRLKDELLLHGINLPSIFKRKIGNGLSKKFWLDSWIGGPPLCSTFPRLFRLERDTNCVVRDRALVRDFRNPTDNRPLGLSFNWNWSRPIRSIAEHQEVLELVNILLPTRYNLDRRGIDLHSTRCPVCDEDIETEEHLFSSCYIAIDTWAKVLVWWNIPNMTISSLMDVVNLVDRVAIPTNHRAAFDVVVQTTLWILWRFRNETCFSPKRPSKELILNDIKLSSFNSISCRLGKAHLNWIHWFDNPCSSLCM